MMLWMNATINSCAISGLLHLNQAPFKSLINFSAFSQWGVRSRFAPCV